MSPADDISCGSQSRSRWHSFLPSARRAPSDAQRRPTTPTAARNPTLIGPEARTSSRHATFKRAIALDPILAGGRGLAAPTSSSSFRPSPSGKRASVPTRRLSARPHLPRPTSRAETSSGARAGFPHKSLADFRRALEINPSLAEAHRYLGRVYYHLGFFEKSLEEFRQALRADPKDLWVLYRIGNVHLYDMEPAKVVAHTDKLPETAFSGEKGLALSYLGRDKEALAITEAALKREPNNEDNLSIHAVLLARKGDREGAERAIALSIASGKGRGHFHHDEYWFGAAYALLGEKKEAISWLEKAVEHGFPCYPYFQKDPYLDPLGRSGIQL